MEEEEYFRSIEDYFLQKKGNPFPLSPKEWILIHEWYEANIPQEVVLRAIEAGYENKKNEKPVTLTYFRRIVKSEYKKHLKSLEGVSGDSAVRGPEASNIKSFLERAIDDLSRSDEKARQGGNVALADLLVRTREKITNEILAGVSGSEAPDLQRVEHQLSLLEKEVEQVLLQTIPKEQMENWKEDAMRELKMFEQKVDWAVYQEMVNRAVIKSIRKLYDIPRLSLFYM